MTTINKDEVKKIADVAKLTLSEKELDEMTEHLRSFMDFAAKIDELNTADVERTTHVLKEQPVALRDDQAKSSLTQDEALKNAPDRKSTRLNSSHVAISYAVFCL